MQRHDLDAGLRVDLRLCMERVQSCAERGPVRQIRADGVFRDEREDALGRDQIDRLGCASRPTQRQPHSAHHRRQRRAPAIPERRSNRSDETLEADPTG